MSGSRADTRWRVQRVGGLLVPGFSKQLNLHDRRGMTYLWGIPIGRFAIEQTAAGVELRYVRWPVVDVLHGDPSQGVALPASGNVRLAGGRLTRFCTFRLVPPHR